MCVSTETPISEAAIAPKARQLKRMRTAAGDMTSVKKRKAGLQLVRNPEDPQMLIVMRSCRRLCLSNRPVCAMAWFIVLEGNLYERCGRGHREYGQHWLPSIASRRTIRAMACFIVLEGNP